MAAVVAAEGVCAVSGGKCPPFTRADLEQSREVQASNLEMARYVDQVGTLAVAIDVSKAVSLIDISRHARAAGDLGSAEHALDDARRLLVALIIPPEGA